MSFDFQPLPGLDGPLIIQPRRLEDARGWLEEVYKASEFAKAGIQSQFVQEIHSRSGLGVVRGLHHQLPPSEQGKLVRCAAGAVFDVAVDIRRSSPTFGRWSGLRLDARDGKMLWIPPGFAHGFQALEDASDVLYLLTAEYDAGRERTIRADDSAIGIKWPLPQGPMATKDAAAPGLRNAELPEGYRTNQTR